MATLPNEGKKKFRFQFPTPASHLPLLSATTIITHHLTVDSSAIKPIHIALENSLKTRIRSHENTNPLFPQKNACWNHHRRLRKARSTSSNITRLASQQQYLHKRNLRLQTENMELQRRVKALGEDCRMVGSYALNIGYQVWGLLVYMGDTPDGSLPSILFRSLECIWWLTMTIPDMF